MEVARCKDGLRCRWILGAPPPPFRGSPRDLRWSVDTATLWTSDNTQWIEWDVASGRPRRRALAPDNTRVRVPTLAQIAAVEERSSFGRPKYWIVAWSPDLTRCVRRTYPDGAAQLCDDRGAEISGLDDLARPMVFSADGTRLLARMSGASTVAIVRAIDGDLVDLAECRVPLGELTELTWTSSQLLLINEQVPGHREDRLICRSLDGSTRWEQAGYFIRVQVDADERTVAAFHGHDGTLWRWELETGRELERIAPTALPRGPLLCGEPDVAALMDALRARPISFASVDGIEDLRISGDLVGVKRAGRWSIFDGDGTQRDVAPPWAWLDPAECARALRACAGGPRDDIAQIAVSSDGAFALLHVMREVSEVPDPDAGTVLDYTSMIGRYDRAAATWRWLVRGSTSSRHFRLSADDSALIEESDRGGEVYDTATGVDRASRETDRTWMPAHGWVELVEPDETITASAVIDERSFVVGTNLGRVLRVDVS